ncbi:MAG: L,D-transpeptidase [Terriglobales bacterium]
MKQVNRKASKQRHVIWIFTLLMTTALALTTHGAALQVSAPAQPGSKSPDFKNIAAPTMLAKTTVHWMLVSIPDRKLALFANGKLVRVYPVAVGKSSTPSPVGEFKIVNHVSNPTYYHKGKVIAAGAGNPVGTRWMGLSAKGYGIHGTNQPNSIGHAASTGCIRMSKPDLEELFTIVDVGDTVQIRSERDEQVASVFGPGPGADSESTTIAQGTAESNSIGGQ